MKEFSLPSTVDKPRVYLSGKIKDEINIEILI